MTNPKETTVFIQSITAMERETYGRSGEIARKISRSMEDAVGRAIDKQKCEGGLLRGSKPADPKSPEMFSGNFIEVTKMPKDSNITVSINAKALKGNTLAEIEANMTITALRQLLWQKEAEVYELRDRIAAMNKVQAKLEADIEAKEAEMKAMGSKVLKNTKHDETEWVQPRSFFPRGI